MADGEIVLSVRVTDEEMALFKAAATLVSRSLSNWVRERLRRIAEQELMEAGKKET